MKISPVRTGSYDASSFLPTSLSPVRTGSYDTLLILLSLLEPVLTGDSSNGYRVYLGGAPRNR